VDADGTMSGVMPEATPAVDVIVARLRQSRRYGTLAETTLRRAARDALRAEQGGVSAAVKRAKRDLHEIHGASVGAPLAYQRMAGAVARAAASHDDETIRRQLTRIMRRHASTAERLPLIDHFYQELFAQTGPPASITDLACGLHPLAAPWMRLGAAVTYTAVDIDTALIGFLDQSLGHLGVAHHAIVGDLLTATPPPGDVTLLLKAIPTLERQAAGAGFGLVERIAARVVVASFPTASLGGRAKGMARSYAERFQREASRRRWRHQQLSFPTELVYLVWK
jgi:16S rRNA (guanine(1405)-N(7))-methyltransferase